MFPIRPPHLNGEPAHGYLLRLVEANGYPWRGEALAARGIDLAELAHGKGLNLLLEHGRACEEGLVASTPNWSKEGRFSMQGELLFGSQIVFGRKRFCPLCWSDDRRANAATALEGSWNRHLRCWWGVAAVTACPIHSIELISRCGMCSRELVFDQGSLTSCRCGADLERLRWTSIEPGWLSLEAYLVGRLGGTGRISVPVLDRLALSDVIALVPRLGSLKMLAQGEGTGSLRDFDARTLSVAGMEVAASDDGGVERMLDTIIARGGSADAMRKPFGGVYEWMAALPEGDLRTWLGERMGVMVGKRGILWTNWRKFVATDPTADRISIAEAGAILGLSEHATRRVIPPAALAAFDTRRRIRPSYERRHVEGLRSRLDHTLTVVATAHRLGTTPRSLRELVRAGLIETDQLAGVAFGNAARFSIETLDRFLDDLSDGAPVFDMPPTGVLRLPVATRRVGNVKLCRALLLRAVRPCGRLSGPKSLSSILISESALGSIRHAGTMGCVATKEAAKILELRERTFNALTAAGHLQAAIHISSTKYYRLSDLENFNRKYITSHEIARASGTNTATVLAVLEETGLRPSIEMESSDRIEVRFFERSRVERRRSINPYQTRGRRSASRSPMSTGGRQPLEIQPKQERFVQKTQSV